MENQILTRAMEVCRIRNSADRSREEKSQVAVMEPIVEKKLKAQAKPKRQPRYQVLLWDDNDHSYEYVIEMMNELFGYPLPKGFEIATAVDRRGFAVCLTTTMEHAELKRDQIVAFGRDEMIASSKCGMRATIEPIE